MKLSEYRVLTLNEDGVVNSLIIPSKSSERNGLTIEEIAILSIPELRSQLKIATSKTTGKKFEESPRELLKRKTLNDLKQIANFEIFEVANVPSEYGEFIGAWKLKEKKIEIDIEKAKNISTDRIRANRNAKWSGFDNRYTAAQRDKIDLTELDKERQKLKDLPKDFIEKSKNITAAEDLLKSEKDIYEALEI